MTDCPYKKVLDNGRIFCGKGDLFGEHPHIGVCNTCEAHWQRTGSYPTHMGATQTPPCEHRSTTEIRRICGCMTVHWWCGKDDGNVPVNRGVCKRCLTDKI